MSLIQPIPRPVVPCSICHVRMVELGRMGDTGNKKCRVCTNKIRYQTRKNQGKRYYKLRVATCKRCGKKFSGSQKGVCQLCQIIIIDLYNNMKNKDCVYCGKPSGKNDFCSRPCSSNAANLMGLRNKKIDRMIKDVD